MTPPSDDPELLPPELSAQSLSPRQIILPLDAALAAIEHLSASGRRLEAWEGYVRLPDGGRTRSLAHAGSFALPLDGQAAAQTAERGMREAQTRWDRGPEYAGAQLYFCLTLAPR